MSSVVQFPKHCLENLLAIFMAPLSLHYAPVAKTDVGTNPELDVFQGFHICGMFWRRARTKVMGLVAFS